MQTTQLSEQLQVLLIAIQLDINMYSADSMAGRTFRKSLLSMFSAYALTLDSCSPKWVLSEAHDRREGRRVR